MKVKFSDFNLLLIVSVICGFTGLLFYDDPLIMGSVVTCQVLLLLICLMKNRDDLFMGFFLSFVILSQEFGYFVDDGYSQVFLYSFKETRILGINMALLFIMVYFLKIVLLNSALSILYNKSKLIQFTKELLLISVTAILMGTINFFINDNDIQLLENGTYIFIQQSSYYLYVLLLAFCICFVIIRHGVTFLEHTMHLLMILNLVLPLLASFAGIHGYYGGKTLYLTLSSFLLAMFVIIFPVYKAYNYNSKYYYLLFGLCVLCPIMLRSFALGKLLIFAVIGVLFLLYHKAAMSKAWIVFSSLILTVLLFSTPAILSYINETNDLFGYKYKQVMSLINIINTQWYDNLLPSPKVRVTEFCNIIIEYFHKVYYILLGKGILGTVKDYMNDIPLFNLSVYSYGEFAIGSYYRMHESFNVFFLTSGLLGLSFIAKYVAMLFRHMRDNPWFFIGVIWLVLLWGYSITRATFGIGAICIGLKLLENDYRIKRKENVFNNI